jgi:hypothetical protein
LPITLYIYFNKEGKSQISTNIFLKEQGITTYAYSQFSDSTNKFTVTLYFNKGNAKRGVSPHLKIRPCDLENQ